jgi:hypothetical protein
MKRFWILGLLFLASSASIAEPSPKLSFVGTNGYPSDGKDKYQIDIYAYPDGLISHLVSFSGNPRKKIDDLRIRREAGKILGEMDSGGIKMELAIEPGERAISVTRTESDGTTKKRAVWKRVVRLGSGDPLLFEDEERKYRSGENHDLEVIDKESGEVVYVFDKNQILNDGYYRADWKKDGEKTSVSTYLTMERYGEWIDAGKGAYTGAYLVTPDASLNVVNFYILGSIYPDIPDFIPFLFGLKTGAY